MRRSTAGGSNNRELQPLKSASPRLLRPLLLLAAAIVVWPMFGGAATGDEPKDAAATAKKGEKTKERAQSADARDVAPAITIGDVEPTAFETNSSPLQFDAFEIRSVDLSPDETLLAAGHGRWTTEGAVRVWDLKTKKELAVFPEDRGIASVQFSPDGKYLASSSWTGSVIIRDAKSTEFDEVRRISPGGVCRLAFSPDGKTLATATESQKLQLWDPATGEEKTKLEGTFFRMQQVVFSADGRYVAAGGGKFDNPQNGRVSAWDLQTGKQLKVIENVNQPIIALAFSPDGKTLAAGGFDRVLRAWSVPDLQLKYAAQGHTQGIEGMEFSPDGNVLATVSYDNSVRLWDSRNGEAVAVLNGHLAGVYSVTFARDGKSIYTGGADKIVRIWDAATYRQVEELRPGSDAAEIPSAVLAVACSPDGKFVASSHEDKTVRLRSASGEIVRTLRGHDDVVAHMAFSPDGKLLATAGFDKTVKLWDVSTGKTKQTLEGHSNWVFAAAFSPDGKTLATAGYDKTVRLWNTDDGKPLGEPLTGHSASVRSVSWSPDGERLATGSGDRTVKIWNLKQRKATHTLAGHKKSVRAVEFSPDGGTLASASEDQTVKLWDAGSGGELRTFSGHTGMVWCLAFSPEGKSLASGGFDNAIVVWNPADGSRRATLRGHTEVVTSLAFSPDMRGLISGSYDRSVRLWKAKQPPMEELLTIAASTDAVRTVEFSADGRQFAAAGHDGTLRVWETKTGKQLHGFSAHTGGIRRLRFSRDGKRLVTGAWDRRIHVWDLQTGESIAKMGSRDHDVAAVEFNRDGTQVVSGGIDGTLRLWDVASGKQLWKSAKHALPFTSIDVSPDGLHVVGSTGDYKRRNEAGEVKVWDLESGRELYRLDGPQGNVGIVEFSPDGRYIGATVGENAAPFRLWDVKTRQPVELSIPTNLSHRFTFLPGGRTIAIARRREFVLYDLESNREIAAFTGHPDGQIFELAATPDSSLIASASQDGTVKLWSTRREPGLTSLLTIPAHKGTVRFAMALPDGKRIVTGGHDHLVKVFDRETGKLLKTLEGHKGGVTCGALSPDGSLLVTGSWDKTVRYWNMKTMEPGEIVLRHKGEVVALQFVNGGKNLLTAGRTNMLQVWEVESGRLRRSSEALEKPVADFDVSPDEDVVAAAVAEWKTPRESSTLQLFRLSDLSRIATVASYREEIKQVRYSPDGARLLATGTRGVFVYDAKTRKRLQHLWPGYGVPRANFTADGRRIVTGGWFGEVAFWNLANGERLARGTGHSRFLMDVRLDPSGGRILTAGDDGTVRVWPLYDHNGTIAGRVREWASPRSRLAMQGVVQKSLIALNEQAEHAAADRDFNKLALAMSNGEVRLYNVSGMTLATTLLGHKGSVGFASFSPDGALLATAGDDATVRLWDVADGELKFTMSGHEGRVRCVRFTPDGKRLVSCGMKGGVHVWNVSDGKKVASIPETQRGIIRIAISPDGSLLALGGHYKAVNLWDLNAGKQLGRLSGHKHPVVALEFSPDGRQLASSDAGDETSELRLWDVSTRTLRRATTVKTNRLPAIAFSSDNRTVVAYGGDGNFHYFHAATGERINTVPSGHSIEVRSIEWPPDGERMLTIDQKGAVRLWRMQPTGRLWMDGNLKLPDGVNYRQERTAAEHGNSARFAVYSPDGGLLATGGEDNAVRVWDVKTWKLKFPPIEHSALTPFAAFSPEGDVLASADVGGNVVLTSVETGKRLRTLVGRQGAVRKVAFTPDGKSVLFGGRDGVVRVWDVNSGKQTKTFEAGMDVWALDVSPDGKRLAVATGNWEAKKLGAVSIWELETGKRIKTLLDGEAHFHSVRFISNDRLAIGCGGSRGPAGVSLWDVNSEKRLAVLHWAPNVRRLHVSPDGKLLAAAHGGENHGLVDVWDLQTNRQISHLRVSSDYLFSVEFSPDGKRLATASKGGKVQIWRQAEPPPTKTTGGGI